MREPTQIDGGKGDTNLQADSSEVVKGKTRMEKLIQNAR